MELLQVCRTLSWRLPAATLMTWAAVLRPENPSGRKGFRRWWPTNGRVLLAATVAVSLSLLSNAYAAADTAFCQPSAGEARQSHAGHYVAMGRNYSASDIAGALAPGVAGAQVRYLWRELEPERGRYDFSRIRSDLAAVAAQGRQLVVFIEDKTFAEDIPLPSYLHAFALVNRAGGYTAARWQPQVVDRMNALTAALAAEFDAHANFEGIAFQESALSLNDDVLDQNGYSANS